LDRATEHWEERLGEAGSLELAAKARDPPRRIKNWMKFAMDEPLQKTLVDAVHFLEAERVPYALIGGLAVSLRGQPRMTADVDMVILANVPRSLALARGLGETNFRSLFDVSPK
jgi:hypothetical protein